MFITDRGLFSTGLTFRRSTGSFCKYVNRSVEVPMHGYPAWAIMPPLSKRFFLYQTAAAALLGGVGRIHKHDFATGFFRLVADHAGKLCPTAIQYLFRQETSRQSFVIQVFHGDKRMIFHKDPACLVEEVPPLVCESLIS